MNEHAEEEPEKKIGALFDDLYKFQNGAEQFDDITMLEFSYKNSALPQ